MRAAFLGKVYPWLLPAIVTLLLILSLAGAERVRRSTPEGKFNRIHVGMSEERVNEILDWMPPGFSPPTPSGSWVFEEYSVTAEFDHEISRLTVSYLADHLNVTIHFDDKKQVIAKALERFVKGRTYSHSITMKP